MREQDPGLDHPADSNAADSDSAAFDALEHLPAAPLRSAAGKFVIASIFGVTLAMALFAIWFRQASSRQTRELFGIEHAQRIQLATSIHALRLPEPRSTLDLAELPPAESGEWRPVTKVSGMTHVQGALMEDRSFGWGQEPDCEPQWQHVFRFRDAQGGLTHVGLDLDCTRLMVLETGRAVSFAPMATFLRRFVESLYPPSAEGTGADDPRGKPASSPMSPSR